MELIAQIPLLGGFLATVLPFLLVLGIVVFVHEFGHYIVGRWCGIRAEVFSIGFGAPLAGWTDGHGTRWQLAAIPLGGYVKFEGDTDATSYGARGSGAPGSFPGASVGRRALTVLAGPVANFILSIMVFSGLALWQGEPVNPPTIGAWRVPLAAGQDAQPGDRILTLAGQEVAGYGDLYAAMDGQSGPLPALIERGPDRFETELPPLMPALVGGVQPLSPASDAGLREGDLILSLNGENLQDFSALREIVLASEGIQITMRVLRAGEVIEMQITPEITDTPTAEGGFEQRVMIGVIAALAFEPMTVAPSVPGALMDGVRGLWRVLEGSLSGLRHIITGALGADNLQGPLGIAQVSGASAAQGSLALISLIGVLSAAIGMLNLFPIPVLDGGHLIVYAYEALTGRPPPEKALGVAMNIGLVLLMALMMFTTYNDLMRL